MAVQPAHSATRASLIAHHALYLLSVRLALWGMLWALATPHALLPALTPTATLAHLFLFAPSATLAIMSVQGLASLNVEITSQQAQNSAMMATMSMEMAAMLTAPSATTTTVQPQPLTSTRSIPPVSLPAPMATLPTPQLSPVSPATSPVSPVPRQPPYAQPAAAQPTATSMAPPVCPCPASSRTTLPLPLPVLPLVSLALPLFPAPPAP